jgi:subfamily B ATP-binding cassette protein MsbA
MKLLNAASSSDIGWLIWRRPWAFASLTATNLLVGVADLFGISLVVPLFDLLANKGKPTGFTAGIADLLAAVGLKLTLNAVLFVLIGLALVKFALLVVAAVQQSSLINTMRDHFRVEVLDSLTKSYYAFIVGQSSARFQNILTTELEAVTQAIKSLAAGIINVSLVFIFIFASLLVNWQMTLMTAILGLVIMGGLHVAGKRMRRLSRKLTAQNQDSQHLVQTVLGAIKYLKATGNAPIPIEQFKIASRERTQTAVKMATVRALSTSAIEPISIVFAALFAAVTVHYLGQSMTEIVLPLLFLYRTGSRIGGLQRSVNAYSQGIGSIMALRRTLGELEEARERSGPVIPEPLTTGIELKDVSYEINGKKLLEGVSLLLPARTTIGVVGETGAGKTTLIDVVSGLLRPTAGTIRWDGIDFASLDMNAVRARFGYLTQDPAVFNDTACNNITMWNGETSQGQVHRAAVRAQAADFIEESLGGYDVPVGERGQRLSGGQRQRLALAREFYRDPEVLIIDEGTSALDAEMESLIKDALRDLQRHKTIIMVAHRLSTLRHCDMLVVLNRGSITARGTWEELEASSPWFARTLELQRE